MAIAMGLHTPLLKVEGVQPIGVITPVSFTIESSGFWSLTGPSGSGKSQLLKALADLIPHQGQVWLKGVAQTAFSAPHWRAQVMYFSAESAWWLETVKAHFITPPSDADLKQLGLSVAILSQRPDDCSSGEKQRLALLRGLERHPLVLLLDEVTANLDLENTLKVESFLQVYLETNRPGCSIIWITHDTAQKQRLFKVEQQIQLGSHRRMR